MEESKASHVVIIPTPGMGHLIPFVELAKRLIHRDSITTVTFVVIGEGPPTIAQRTVLDSLPSSISSVFLPPVNLTDLPSTARILTRISHTVTRSNPELRRVFNSLAEEGRSPTALVVDLFGTNAFDVAHEFQVSPYIFYPSNTNVLSFFLHLPRLDETVSCEFWELTEPVKLPGCVPVSGKDIIDTAQDRKNEGYKYTAQDSKRYKEAKGILVNSFIELEPNAIKALQEPGLDKPPVYPIGPLVNTGKQEDNEFEELQCLKWLDDQPLSSVLYVSFGSGGTLTCEQINELALGLEKSDQRFLWVIRSPSSAANSSYFDSHSKTDPLTCLPPGFLERTKGRGFVIPSWAPQALILAHPSTGGFLTHCGWNSTLESIVNGVPLIAWPLYAEQKMNAMLLTEDIRVAFRAHAGHNGVVRKEEVARVVKGLMEGKGLINEGKKGKGVRIKMKEMKEGACRVLEDDGSSTKALNQLVF
ncbi:PREDICTED: UDP-glycosyltransferase 72B1-like [Camelina sativa]|uniref:Glycosyltransferase n=1 Tax=Camelina sativa TaxID=90675 RepID=A0ABM1RP09_CAMSA|nr:PREDICTED: UDP-glycosyltransferase 72B1-like [Camelina sativa]